MWAFQESSHVRVYGCWMSMDTARTSTRLQLHADPHTHTRTHAHTFPGTIASPSGRATPTGGGHAAHAPQSQCPEQSRRPTWLLLLHWFGCGACAPPGNSAWEGKLRGAGGVRCRDGANNKCSFGMVCVVRRPPAAREKWCTLLRGWCSLNCMRVIAYGEPPTWTWCCENSSTHSGIFCWWDYDFIIETNWVICMLRMLWWKCEKIDENADVIFGLVGYLNKCNCILNEDKRWLMSVFIQRY